MPTHAMDHVNILTDDLDGTIAFYEQTLELTSSASPIAQTGRRGAWMRDAAGNAIVHLVERVEGPMHEGHVIGQPTAAVHHVAFRCTGFAEAKARLDGMGLTPRVNDGMLGLRQIFLVDPNGVNLELNFSGD